MTEKPKEEAVLTLSADDVQNMPLTTSGAETPVIYTDSIRGAMVLNEVAKINLMQTRMNLQTNSLVSTQVATLAVPASQLKAWGEFFLKMAVRDEADLTEDGEQDAK